jgi:predicted transglutaminase-like cysteine proteinase
MGTCQFSYRWRAPWPKYPDERDECHSVNLQGTWLGSLLLVLLVSPPFAHRFNDATAKLAYFLTRPSAFSTQTTSSSSRPSAFGTQTTSLSYRPSAPSTQADKQSGESREPFGLRSPSLIGGPVVEKWTAVEGQIAMERKLLAACRSKKTPCPAAAVRFQAIVDTGRTRNGRARIGTINRAVNLAIAYKKKPGTVDRWSTPLITLDSQTGNCMDYAITKFAALEEAGIDSANLRIVIVHDLRQNADHAIVAVRDRNEWLVLDNRHFALATDAQTPRVTPLLILGHADPYGAMPFVAGIRGNSTGG